LVPWSSARIDGSILTWPRCLLVAVACQTNGVARVRQRRPSQPSMLLAPAPHHRAVLTSATSQRRQCPWPILIEARWGYACCSRLAGTLPYVSHGVPLGRLGAHLQPFAKVS
jgi:hypothetical protein